MADARGATKWLEFSPEKLRTALASRNLKQTDVARELGVGCAISNALARGRISQPVMILLDKVYGISEGEIKITEPKPRNAASIIGDGWVQEMRRFAIKPELVAFVQSDDFKRAVKEALEEVLKN